MRSVDLALRRPAPPLLIRLARPASAAVVAAVLHAGSVHAQLPETGAERAAFERTSSHAEVMDFLEEVAQRSDRVVLDELAVTNQGRPVPIVHLGSPPATDPASAWMSGRPTIFFTGSVHGDERAGKEGSQQLLRELALGELAPLLDEVNVIVVPSLNPDGAERPGRTNSLGYDMNRDFVALETPEISAVVDVIARWRPDVFVDVHNGGAYPYNVTYQATLHPAADDELVEYARGPLYDGIREHLASQDMITYWYSGPRRTDAGEWVWRTTPPWTRKQHTYGGLHNVVTLLFEIPGRWSLEEQAANAREAMEGLLREVAGDPELLRGVVRGAQGRTVAGPGPVVIDYEETAYPEPEDFLVLPERGAEPELVTGENRTLFVPTETRPWPYAYAFDGRFDEAAHHLVRHGIRVERLTAPALAVVERYRATAVGWADEPYQNHLLAEVEVELEEPGQQELPAGSYLIRTGQNAGRLLTHLLEPDTEDSLVRWNFFDHSLPDPDDLDDLDDPEYLPILRLPVGSPVATELVR